MHNRSLRRGEKKREKTMATEVKYSMKNIHLQIQEVQ